MSAKLQREALQWGDTTLIANQDRLRPGGDQLEKESWLAECLDNWHAATRGVYAASLVSQGLGGGVRDPCYRDKLIKFYISAMDELPDEAA